MGRYERRVFFDWLEDFERKVIERLESIEQSDRKIRELRENTRPGSQKKSLLRGVPSVRITVALPSANATLTLRLFG